MKIQDKAVLEDDDVIIPRDVGLGQVATRPNVP